MLRYIASPENWEGALHAFTREEDTQAHANTCEVLEAY